LALAVTIVTPESAGPGAADAAAALGDAVARAVGEHARYTRVGDTPLLPSEVVTAFECDRLDAECAARAGAAAGSQRVILGHVVGLEAGIEFELELVDVARRGGDRRVLRFVHTGPGAPGDSLRPALDVLVRELLDGVVPPDGPPPYEPTSGGARRLLGWSAAGLGVVALAGSATAGVLMEQSQARYDRARDGLEVRRLADEGRGRAMAANVLLATGAVALGAGIVLLLLE